MKSVGFVILMKWWCFMDNRCIPRTKTQPEWHLIRDSKIEFCKKRLYESKYSAEEAMNQFKKHYYKDNERNKYELRVVEIFMQDEKI